VFAAHVPSATGAPVDLRSIDAAIRGDVIFIVHRQSVPTFSSNGRWTDLISVCSPLGLEDDVAKYHMNGGSGESSSRSPGRFCSPTPRFGTPNKCLSGGSQTSSPNHGEYPIRWEPLVLSAELPAGGLFSRAGKARLPIIFWFDRSPGARRALSRVRVRGPKTVEPGAKNTRCSPFTKGNRTGAVPPGDRNGPPGPPPKLFFFLLARGGTLAEKNNGP